jgi:hypothetical protein
MAEDLVPPARPAATASGGDAAAAASGDPDDLGEGMRVSGPYELRDALQGDRDGQYGFFRIKETGEVMVCAWSAASRTWTDLGKM